MNSPYWLRLNVGLLLLVCGYFSLTYLATIPGLIGDEAYLFLWTKNLLSGTTDQLRTPNGSLMNIFLTLPQAFISQVVPQSSLLGIRLPAVLSYWLQISLSYLLVWRLSRNRSAALVAVTVTATLPLHLISGRVGVEQSQINLIILIWVYCLLTGRWFALVLAMLAANLVHPITTLLIPGTLLVLALKRTQLNRSHILALILALGLIGLNVWSHPDKTRLTSSNNFSSVTQFLSIDQWLFWSSNILDLLTASGTYHHLASELSVNQRASMRWVAICVIGCLFYFFWQHRKQVWQQPIKLLSILVLTGFFGLVASFDPSTYGIGSDRYAMWLLPPLIVTLTLLVHALPQPKTVLILISLVGWLNLLSFYHLFWQPFQISGGRGHVAFQTAEIEPKRQLALWLLDQSQSSSTPPLVITDSWWLH